MSSYDSQKMSTSPKPLTRSWESRNRDLEHPSRAIPPSLQQTYCMVREELSPRVETHTISALVMVVPASLPRGLSPTVSSADMIRMHILAIGCHEGLHWDTCYASFCLCHIKSANE
jgi:hypothetical protein